MRLDSYRTRLGVVLQESFLFDGTIRENVAFSRPYASEEEILAACRIARVDEFAERFPETYDTIIGERGVKLSGGQRQRVSIARAILADPRILILDEATSSLDSESEMLIQEGLAQLMRGRTTFVIAHRLSTIRRADQILVVEGGKIVERGTHASLYALAGRYRELYDKQHGLEANLFLATGEGEIPEPAEADGARAEKFRSGHDSVCCATARRKFPILLCDASGNRSLSIWRDFLHCLNLGSAHEWLQASACLRLELVQTSTVEAALPTSAYSACEKLGQF